MNLERFYLIADVILKGMQKGGVESAYDAVLSALNNQIRDPQEQHLIQISESIKNLKSAINKSGLDDFPPTWRRVIEDLDIGDLIGSDLGTWVQKKISTSGALLTEARDDIQLDTQRLSQALENLRNFNTAFDFFEIEKPEVGKGEAELSLYLPRKIFNNEVLGFSKSLMEFERFVSTCAEAATGQVEHIKLKQISASDPIIFALVSAPTTLFVMKVVNEILDIYKKVVEIREIKKRTEAIDIKDGIPEKLEKVADKYLRDRVSEFIKKIKGELRLPADKGRQQELLSKLERLIVRLAAQIDHGARLEGWAANPEKTDENTEEPDDAEIYREIRRLARPAQNFEVEGEPVLKLPAPNDEDEP